MARNRKPEPSPTIANVHRFRDKVGAWIGEGPGNTAYLSAADARRVGEALIAAAVSIETETFVASNLPGITLTAADINQ